MRRLHSRAPSEAERRRQLGRRLDARGRQVPAPARAARASRGSRPARLGTTGLTVGLGEPAGEVVEVLVDAADAGADAITIGQYLQAHAACLPVCRYVTPGEFAACEGRGAALGLTVGAAPFVRSSYRAGELLEHGS